MMLALFRESYSDQLTLRTADTGSAIDRHPDSSRRNIHIGYQQSAESNAALTRILKSPQRDHLGQINELRRSFGMIRKQEGCRF